jgi:predicted ATPase
MITRIKLKSGSSVTSPFLEFDLTPITVFVGPNNSGKSKVLMEIEEDSHMSNSNVPKLVLDEVTYMAMSEADITEDLRRLKEPFLTENTIRNMVTIGKVDAKSQSIKSFAVYEQNIIAEAQNGSMVRNMFLSIL